MFWWVALAVIVIGLALLWYRGRSRSGGSSSVDQAAVAKTRRDGQARGFGGGGGF
jgi:hypothetical protein